MTGEITYRATNHGADAIYNTLAQLDWDAGDFEVVIRKHDPDRKKEKKETRSEKQNRLSHKWYAEIHAQTRNGVNYERARCKIMYGVPILRAEEDGFRETYDKFIRGYTTEEKIEIMERFEIPITSLMSVKQMSVYLNTVDMETADKQNIILTHPEDLYLDALGVRK